MREEYSTAGCQPHIILGLFTNNATVSSTGTLHFAPATALPVTWLDVSGEHKNGSNYIFWATANEYSNNYFVIEASANGNDFFEAGRIKSNRNSMTPYYYHFIHNKLTSDVYYYRIKQVDLDGRYSYSKTIKISGCLPAVSLQNVYPNPVNNKVSLEIIAGNPAYLSVTLSGISGRAVLSKEAYLTKGINKLELDMTSLPAGIYTLGFKDSDNTMYQTEKIIKQ